MERKLIELLIGDEGTGLPVEAISLVKFPAIEENFLFFSKGKNTKALSLAQVEEDKRTLIGAASFLTSTYLDMTRRRMRSTTCFFQRTR